eukprot:3778080-Pyramimonas_sp.AAC.1
MMRKYILTTGAARASMFAQRREVAGIFSRRTNQTHDAQVYSRDGCGKSIHVRSEKRGSGRRIIILTVDQLDAGCT